MNKSIVLKSIVTFLLITFIFLFANRLANAAIYDAVTYPSDPNFYLPVQNLSSARFFNSEDIAVDADGNIFVSDTDHQRIQKYNSSGVFQKSILLYGSTLLTRPTAITIDKTNSLLYVVDIIEGEDTTYALIHKYNTSGTYIETFGLDQSLLANTSFEQIGINVAPNGDIFYVQYDNDTVLVLNNDGTLDRELTGFKFPTEVNIDSSGNYYVVDTNILHTGDESSSRIRKYDSSDNLLNTYNVLQEDSQPNGSGISLNIDSTGNVILGYSDNYPHNVIRKYDSSFSLLSTIDLLNDSAILDSNDRSCDTQGGATLDTSDNIYVACYGTQSRVRKYGTDNSLSWVYGSNGYGFNEFKNPADAVVDATGSVWVINYSESRINRLSSNGMFDNTYVIYSSGTSIDIDGSDNLYVLKETVQTGGKHIYKYDYNVSGTPEITWGDSGSLDGQFTTPKGLAISSDNYIYVADTGNNRIQKLQTDGTFVTKWGEVGTGDSQFDSPTAIAIDINGNVYVADTGNNRVQKFDNAGAYITSWSVTNPLGITVHKSKVYISSGDSISVYSTSGELKTTFGSLGSSVGQFNKPIGLTTNRNGDIYVVDNGNFRLQKFNAKYQAYNVDETLDVLDENSGNNVETGSSNGVVGDAQVLRLTDSSGTILSDMTLDVVDDKDFTNVAGESDTTNGKAVVRNLGDIDAISLSTLYVPIADSQDDKVVVCPNATQLSDVSNSCSSGIELADGDNFGEVLAAKTSINGDDYWSITGLLGGGGISTKTVSTPIDENTDTPTENNNSGGTVILAENPSSNDDDEQGNNTNGNNETPSLPTAPVAPGSGTVINSTRDDENKKKKSINYLWLLLLIPALIWYLYKRFKKKDV